MKHDSEYMKEIKSNLWNISEDMACDILTAYYKHCKADDEPCIDSKGRYIYNLMDNKQASDAVKAFGFSVIAESFVVKSDWILLVDIDKVKDNFVFITEAPSIVLNDTLPYIIYAYCLDPMAYPAFFRESVNKIIANVCNLHI